jgi:HNH endonuclease
VASKKSKNEKRKAVYLRMIGAQALRLEWEKKSKTYSDNELAGLLFYQTNDFLFSEEWRALRLAALDRYGTDCAKCSRPNSLKFPVNVDHIKPRKFFPHLALDIENLQPLCHPCNKEKGNKDAIDYRKTK